MFHVVKTPVSWSQHMPFPSCCEQVNDARKLKSAFGYDQHRSQCELPLQKCGFLHYYEFWSESYHFSKKVLSQKTQKRKFQILVTLVQLSFLISMPQGSVINDVSVSSEPSSHPQTQRSIYTFLQRPMLYKEILAHTIEIVSSIPVRNARPHEAVVLSVFLFFQALGST